MRESLLAVASVAELIEAMSQIFKHPRIDSNTIRIRTGYIASIVAATRCFGAERKDKEDSDSTDNSVN